MSHIFKEQADPSIVDPVYIRRACEILGVELLENTTPRYYYTASGGREAPVCDFVLKLPGKYDLGLRRKADGSFEYVCDNELLRGNFGMNDPSRKLLGDNAQRLVQTYSMAGVELELETHGVPYVRVQTANGSWAYQAPDPVEVGLHLS